METGRPYRSGTSEFAPFTRENDNLVLLMYVSLRFAWECNSAVPLLVDLLESVYVKRSFPRSRTPS